MTTDSSKATADGPLVGWYCTDCERTTAVTADIAERCRCVTCGGGRVIKGGSAGRPVICEECGIYPADLPSKICPGCDAYREHTGQI